jgi:UDP-glucose 4-epimerase
LRAIVTGGAGFIGSHVVEALLARGDDVLVIDDLSHGKRENLPDDARLEVADIREPLADHFEEAEVCFHLAAQADVRVSVERPGEDAEVNVLGTINVLEAARAQGTGEQYLGAYSRLYGTGHVSLRYGNVYGPRQDPHGEAGVVAIFFGRLAAGERPRIFGDGRATRDYVYVGDVARATLAAVGRQGVFNVGTATETSVLELYDLCRAVAGSDLEAEQTGARLGELQRSVLDASLAERELGWRPEISLEEGLRTTWESFAD